MNVAGFLSRRIWCAYVFLKLYIYLCVYLIQGSRPMDLFRALHAKFAMHSPKTKALLLSAYAKFLNLYPEEQEL